MGQTGWGNVSIEKIVSTVNITELASVTNVTDEDRLDLSHCCDSDTDGNTGWVNLSVDDLNLKRWVAAENFVRSYFKSVQEGQGLNGSLEVSSEG